MQKKQIQGNKGSTRAKPRKVRKASEKKPAAAKEWLGVHNLVAPAGSHKKKKLLGRGSGSGHGKTSTRGSKGQTSRAGRDFYPGFEGGQTPLIRRIPKRGFTSRSRKIFQPVNLKDLGRIKESLINPQAMEDKGLVSGKNKLIKILGEGEIKRPVTIQAHAFSRKAAQAIRDAGGKAEVINRSLEKSV